MSGRKGDAKFIRTLMVFFGLNKERRVGEGGEREVWKGGGEEKNEGGY